MRTFPIRSYSSFKGQVWQQRRPIHMAWLKNYVIRRSNSPIFFQISVGANNCLNRSSAKPGRNSHRNYNLQLYWSNSRPNKLDLKSELKMIQMGYFTFHQSYRNYSTLNSFFKSPSWASQALCFCSWLLYEKIQISILLVDNQLCNNNWSETLALLI